MQAKKPDLIFEEQFRGAIQIKTMTRKRMRPVMNRMPLCFAMPIFRSWGRPRKCTSSIQKSFAGNIASGASEFAM
jgi:hypothetical protein